MPPQPIASASAPSSSRHCRSFSAGRNAASFAANAFSSTQHAHVQRPSSPAAEDRNRSCVATGTAGSGQRPSSRAAEDRNTWSAPGVLADGAGSGRPPGRPRIATSPPGESQPGSAWQRPSSRTAEDRRRAAPPSADGATPGTSAERRRDRTAPSHAGQEGGPRPPLSSVPSPIPTGSWRSRPSRCSRRSTRPRAPTRRADDSTHGGKSLRPDGAGIGEIERIGRILRQTLDVRLREMAVENFRAFRQARLRTPETGLVLVVGANNTGKSALLSALDLVAGAADSGGPFRHAGSPEPARVTARFALEDDERAGVLAGVASADQLLADGALASVEFIFEERQ